MEKLKMSAGKAQIGKLAPDFIAKAVMPDMDFKDIKLSDYRGKYVVFFFYPLDFTFVCPTEIIAFSDAADEFRKIDCEVIAASTDSHFSHFAWCNTPRKQGGLGAMKIPLVSDTRRTISTDYGVLKEDEGIAYRFCTSAYITYIELLCHYNSAWELIVFYVCFRGLFIIDTKGILRQITINDIPVGRSVDETLRLVQAFQFTDKYGEVCPAGWKPGSDTIKPDIQKSKDFFSKQ
ncbi:peroxiredoxin-1 isoform X2 [Boleophthalmus pectinirostris]|uniref:peroxiredoxin-1 isoform X2 n=1 Tax=Boleophthalmus pectinirostris TaxID=150288 RepID=UPI002432FBEA|nr:peroxiredoxin-1 isoform X2 [Boleophthalmus pectinirostris]